jgi:hypothetical protein
MKDQFYSIAFRKKIYHSLEELQRDVDEWLAVYNHQRPHKWAILLWQNSDANIQR